MTTWVVGGSCRGVGKTWLCLRLENVLPAAVYAKIGHGQRRADKPPRYFTDVAGFHAFQDTLGNGVQHCIVESNLLLRSGFGEVRIFLDAATGDGEERADASLLRAMASIVIGPDRPLPQWQPIRAVLAEPELGEAVACALAESRRHLVTERARCPTYAAERCEAGVDTSAQGLTLGHT